MASVERLEDEMPTVNEPPRKRQKVSPTPNTNSTTTSGDANSTMETTSKPSIAAERSDSKEVDCGILHFVNTSNPGFEGVLKQRYTDFLVHEIDLNGTVIHLTDDRAPRNNANTRKVHSSEPIQPPAAELSRDKPVPEPSQDNSAALQSTETQVESGDLDTGSSNVAASDSSNAADTSNKIKPEDFQVLIDYFGHELTEKIFKMYQSILAKPNAKASSFGNVQTEPIIDREIRGRIHGDIRRIFSSKFETEMINEGRILISAARPASQQGGRTQNPRAQGGQAKGKVGWDELGGPYLHFTMEKRNKDTMEVISYLAKVLKIKPKDFGFAGTKDRRAVTVQKVSVWRQHAASLAKINNSLRDARIGNFDYRKSRLELGELSGNQFTITLRDCHFPNETGLNENARLTLGREIVEGAVKGLQTNGFINYFGLQRFGSFGIGTHEIGRKILQDNFEGAVWDILSYNEATLAAGQNPESQNGPLNRTNRDDTQRALAIHTFKQTGRSQEALKLLPSKFGGERAVIQALGSKKEDFAGALLQISRNLKTMYVHAYQSYVWNTVASARWAKYGAKVIPGDLVLEETPTQKAASAKDEVDENGEIVVRPAAHDAAVTHDDLYQRARPLSEEEAGSGKYTIFDVILPTPGFDIEYPQNDIGDYYKEFMGGELGGGLDPGNMRRRHKDFSLSGSYRSLMAEVGQDLNFEVKAYHEETEQLVETDSEKMDRLKSQKGGPSYATSTGRDKWVNKENNSWGSHHQHNKEAGRSRTNNNHYFASKSEEVRRDLERYAGSDALNRWKNLPAQLQTQERAEAETYDTQKAAQEPVDPNTIQQPMIKDTFIETSAGDWSKRTGKKTTVLIAAEGVEGEQSTGERYSNGPGGFDGVSDSKPVEKARELKDKIINRHAKPVDLDHSHKSTAAVSPELPDSAMFDPDTTASLSDLSEGGAQLAMQQDEKVDKSGKPALSPTATEFTPSTTPAPALKADAKEFELSNSKQDYLNNIPTSAEVLLPKGDVQMTGTTRESGAAKRPAEEITQDAKPAGMTQEEQSDVVAEKPAKIAVVVKFTLGSSQYATMALRELMKAGGVKNYTPEFSSAR